MKKYFLFVVSLFCTFHLFAQQNGIHFQRLIGGSNQDVLNSVIQVDGGYVLAGLTASIDGDMTDINRGDFDVVVMRTDSIGNIIWQHTYGGSSSDQNAKIMATNDGGFIVSALTISNDGQLTGNYGNYDMWAFKIDSIGTLLWQKNFGGSLSDEPQNIYATSDGNFLLVGRTSSTDFNVTFNHGSTDIWVVKLDTTGNILWQRSYGSSGADDAYNIVETDDGNYVIYGSVTANDGDVSGLVGSNDLWLLKVEPAAGNIIWQHCYGGIAYEYAQNMIITSDNGFALTGFSASSDSIFNSHQGSGDAFLIKTDSAGNLQWLHSYGGSDVEIAKGITELNDGSFVLCINSQSNDGDVLGNHGSWDGWVINVDNTGSILWQRSYGGTDPDYLMKAFPLDSNRFSVFGYTNSNDGDVTGNHGSSDIWWMNIQPQNIITGITFADLNLDGQKDVNEPFATGFMVRTYNPTWEYSSLPSAQGIYVNYADSGTVNTEVVSNGYFTSTPVVSNFTGFGAIDTINFALAPVPGITDASVSLIPLGAARPGFKSGYNLVYKNHGTEPVTGDIMLILPSTVTLDSISLQPDSINGDTLIWNYTPLSLLSSEEIYLRLQIDIPPIVNIGDTLNFQTTISTVNTDTFLLDNIHQLNQPVTGSFDPNDKTCLQGIAVTEDYIQDGNYLEYLVRFQNTGTDTAFTVRITDILDPSLMTNTFQLIYSSHPCTVTLQEYQLKFSFENILLPDSNINESASHGYVFYRIKADPSITAGTLINNTANIYFDYNESVITNTVSTIITVPSSAEELKSNFLGIYPNPASNSITIFLENSAAVMKDIRLTDISGKEYRTKFTTLPGNYYQLDVHNLNAGLYIISIMTDSGSYSAKLVKE